MRCGHPFQAAAALAAALACGGSSGPSGGLGPTEPKLLSVGSPGRDEDPSVVRAADGTLFVAWMSERGGNADIYVTRTRDGEWSAPVRVTTHVGGDFNPHLLQDDQGAFHLVWFRWVAPFKGNIWYNRSPDGVTWDPAGETQVTRAFDVDDWVPTLVRTADGGLFVYFVSALRTAGGTNDIYVAARRPGADDWDAVAAIPGLNSATEHDHLPFAALVDGVIHLVWVRHDTTDALPWENPDSDLFTATSADGLTWSAPNRLTAEPGNVVNLFPKLYMDEDGAWYHLWLSTRSGAARPFEWAVGVMAPYPDGVRELGELPDGYSHVIAATATPGVYLGAWVQGPEGGQDIYYRFFER